MAKKLVIGSGILAVLIALFLSAAFFVSWWWLQPVSSSPQPTNTFVIPRGQAISIIANRLAEDNFIKQPLAFRVYVKLNNLENQIQSGSFKISPTMSVAEIAHNLTTGTDDVWITIPEGWRREEIAESLGKQGLAAFDEAEFLALTADNEGQLFPDTYLISREATAQSVASLLLNTFDQKVVKGLAEEIEASKYSLDQVLVLASLLEREAVGYDEMRHVAGILDNRLEDGMSLDIDATLQYVKGYDKTNDKWWGDVYSADKEVASPYNTYRNPGLPPKPIANPGLEAIQAALNPRPTDEYFYLHDPSGQIHYAKTLDQHNLNVQRYLR